MQDAVGSSPVRIAGERPRQPSSKRQGRGTGQEMRKLWRMPEGLLLRTDWEQSKEKAEQETSYQF